VLPYNRTLKPRSRNLRREMTDAEQLLWLRLRRKQLIFDNLQVLRETESVLDTIRMAIAKAGEQ